MDRKVSEPLDGLARNLVSRPPLNHTLHRQGKFLELETRQKYVVEGVSS